jgi:hypothetical protein
MTIFTEIGSRAMLIFLPVIANCFDKRYISGGFEIELKSCRSFDFKVSITHSFPYDKLWRLRLTDFEHNQNWISFSLNNTSCINIIINLSRYLLSSHYKLINELRFKN